MKANNGMEFMIDIETLSTKRGGTILEVACVAFNSEGYVDAYVGIFSREESEADGFTVSASTVKWWEKQGGIPEEMNSTEGNVVVLLGRAG